MPAGLRGGVPMSIHANLTAAEFVSEFDDELLVIVFNYGKLQEKPNLVTVPLMELAKRESTMVNDLINSIYDEQLKSEAISAISAQTGEKPEEPNRHKTIQGDTIGDWNKSEFFD